MLRNVAGIVMGCQRDQSAGDVVRGACCASGKTAGLATRMAECDSEVQRPLESDARTGVVSTAQGSPKGASVRASPAQPSKSLGRTITPRLARCGAAAAASKTNCRVRGFAAPSLVFWSMATRPREPTAAQPCAPPVAPTPAKPASPPNSQHPLAEHQGNV